MEKEGCIVFLSARLVDGMPNRDKGYSPSSYTPNCIVANGFPRVKNMCLSFVHKAGYTYRLGTLKFIGTPQATKNKDVAFLPIKTYSSFPSCPSN